jgi:hypothetical protein
MTFASLLILLANSATAKAKSYYLQAIHMEA